VCTQGDGTGAGRTVPDVRTEQDGWPVAAACALALLVGAVLLGELSDAVAATLDGGPAYWMPAGLALVLVRVPRRAVWLGMGGLALGVGGHALLDQRTWAAFVVASGLAALEAGVVLALLRRGRVHAVTALRDVGWLVLAASAAAVSVGLLAGLFWETLAPALPPAVDDGELLDPGLAWARLWAGAHLLGLTTVGVLVLAWGQRLWVRGRAGAAELVLVSSLLVVVSVSVAGLVPRIGLGILDYPYVIAVLVGWLGLRFGPAVLGWATTVVASATVAGTWADGNGPFTDSGEPLRELASTQQFVVLTSIGVLAATMLLAERRRAVEEARESQQLVQSFVDNTAAVVFVKEYDLTDPESFGRYLLVNRQFRPTVDGLTHADVVGRRDDDIHDEATAREYRENDLTALSATGPVTVQETGYDADGRQRTYLTTKFVVPDTGEGRTLVGGISADITAIDEARRQEAESAAMLRAVFAESPVPMLRVSVPRGASSGTVVDVNEAFETLVDRSRHELVGSDPAALAAPSDSEVPASVVAAMRQGGQPVATAELDLTRPDGSTRRVEVTVAELSTGLDRPASDLVLIVVDVSAQREAEAALTRQALHDSLTGLLNRHSLMLRLESAIARLQRHPSGIALFFIDLDGFKEVNDTSGHRAGDRLLTDVAHRMASAVRPEDTFARLGGDEFVVLAEGVITEEEARALAHRLMSAVDVGWEFEGRLFVPTLSIGIALTSDPAVESDDLLRQADLAMYRAKDLGRNRAEIYEPTLERRAHQSLAIRSELMRALAEDAVVVHYQPIVELQTSRVVGVEALARLRGRDGWLMPPSAFVGVAEETGLVVPLGARVLSTALADLARWRRGGHDIGVSVNVSVRQLHQVGFARDVLAELATYRLEPERLTVEVLEEVMQQGTGTAAEELSALRRAGVHVAIDDFGTGYSSLGRLRALPADVLKVDRTFVAGLGASREDLAIVAAVTQVAHELALVVVAEGVETEAQRDELLVLGCQRAQGWLYGRPVPAEEVELGTRSGTDPVVT
jgi:diguanylate cyclase (GGDEF)-like protein/PAS domain S-box-containing protein